jgi:hypothetical protein
MTLMDERALVHAGTGPMVGDDPVRALEAPTPPSSVKAEAGPETLDRARRMRSQFGPESAERVALLGILLARLEDVPFEDVAKLLDVKAPRLTKLMHGEEQVPARAADRWRILAEALEDLQAVLKPRATGRWLRTNIPALHGRTPLDVVSRGGLKAVRELAASYRSEAFS